LIAITQEKTATKISIKSEHTISHARFQRLAGRGPQKQITFTGPQQGQGLEGTLEFVI
jgi:hypothetical protein